MIDCCETRLLDCCLSHQRSTDGRFPRSGCSNLWLNLKTPRCSSSSSGTMPQGLHSSLSHGKMRLHCSPCHLLCNYLEMTSTVSGTLGYFRDEDPRTASLRRVDLFPTTIYSCFETPTEIQCWMIATAAHNRDIKNTGFRVYSTSVSHQVLLQFAGITTWAHRREGLLMIILKKSTRWVRVSQEERERNVDSRLAKSIGSIWTVDDRVNACYPRVNR